VLYDYSIPAFSKKGYRYYLNVNYDLKKNVSTWLRLAQTIYSDQQTSNDGIELNLQLQIIF
jgi:hypothetical protein